MQHRAGRCQRSESSGKYCTATTVLVTEAATSLGILLLLVLPVTLSVLATVILATLPLAHFLRPAVEGKSTHVS